MRTSREPVLYTATRAGTLAQVHVQRVKRYANEREYVYLAWRDGKTPRRLFMGTRDPARARTAK